MINTLFFWNFVRHIKIIIFNFLFFTLNSYKALANYATDQVKIKGDDPKWYRLFTKG